MCIILTYTYNLFLRVAIHPTILKLKEQFFPTIFKRSSLVIFSRVSPVEDTVRFRLPVYLKEPQPSV